MFDFSSAWEEHSSLLETNIRSLQPSSDETFFSHENYNVFSCCMPKRRGGESKRHHLETTADSFPPLLSPLMSNNASAVPKAKTEPIFPEQSSNLVEQEEASFQHPTPLFTHRPRTRQATFIQLSKESKYHLAFVETHLAETSSNRTTRCLSEVSVTGQSWKNQDRAVQKRSG